MKLFNISATEFLRQSARIKPTYPWPATQSHPTEDHCWRLAHDWSIILLSPSFREEFSVFRDLGVTISTTNELSRGSQLFILGYPICISSQTPVISTYCQLSHCVLSFNGFLSPLWYCFCSHVYSRYIFLTFGLLHIVLARFMSMPFGRTFWRPTFSAVIGRARLLCQWPLTVGSL